MTPLTKAREARDRYTNGLASVEGDTYGTDWSRNLARLNHGAAHAPALAEALESALAHAATLERERDEARQEFRAGQRQHTITVAVLVDERDEAREQVEQLCAARESVAMLVPAGEVVGTVEESIAGYVARLRSALASRDAEIARLKATSPVGRVVVAPSHLLGARVIRAETVDYAPCPLLWLDKKHPDGGNLATLEHDAMLADLSPDAVRCIMREIEQANANAAHFATLCQEAHDALDAAGVAKNGTPAERIARLTAATTKAAKAAQRARDLIGSPPPTVRTKRARDCVDDVTAALPTPDARTETE